MSSSQADRESVRPHLREFLADSLTPLEVYRRLSALSPTCFMLESVTGGEVISRYSFLGAGPKAVYRLMEDRLEVEEGGDRRQIEGPPLDALSHEISRFTSEEPPFPFSGGFVGYFGYDLMRQSEYLPARPPDNMGLPVALLARFDSVVVFDHVRQRVVAVSNEVDGQVSREDALRQLDVLSDVLTTPGQGTAVEVPTSTGGSLEATPSMGAAQFRDCVARAKELIDRGDIFQVVLARRWSMERVAEPLALYRSLRMVNPSPYMVLLEAPEVSIVGASPEMLLRKTGDRIETRPIAGTRHRSPEPAEDRRLAEELLEDAKERAEHLMLVDLGRNDIGRVSTGGSVEVTSFMEVERYSHVMHIVSNVEGRLTAGCSPLEALMACFPAGTVSGAPKIRAMEIIDELEPESRGPYAGAVGYFSYSGDMDTCITIRTLVVGSDEVSFTAGAGIVADSDPEAEVRETENKAAAMRAAVELAAAFRAK
ncbi:MAG: anthranilate synthase component I [Thermoanaerobaculia bacterium]|jgi:anthranilate synthase component 1